MGAASSPPSPICSLPPNLHRAARNKGSSPAPAGQGGEPSPALLFALRRPALQPAARRPCSCSVAAAADQRQHRSRLLRSGQWLPSPRAAQQPRSAWWLPSPHTAVPWDLVPSRQQRPSWHSGTVLHHPVACACVLLPQLGAGGRLVPSGGIRGHPHCGGRSGLSPLMDRSWINTRLFGKAHLDGVSDFMKHVYERFDEDAEILCPCRKCLNQFSKHKGQIYHGEGSRTEIIESASHQDEQFGSNVNVGMDEDGDDLVDRLPNMVHELFNVESEDQGKKAMFAMLRDEARTLSWFSLHKIFFVVKLLHIKSFYRISNAAFNALLRLLSLAFPECCIPASYHEAKKLIRALGLGYVSIHVCPNNCILFRKCYKDYNECPVCGASRWKCANGSKRIPQKVLRHFPIIPRLRRFFSSKKLSKHFDNKYGWFAQDPRNIRLGLAIDGFNLFGKMSASYSMWPVFLIPYNFPPWECMEQSNFMMALLIPGKECPGKDIDVFLEPLVEELLELWKGVPTIDALSGKSFDLHAAVIWCIHDYPL
ncbi:LOW QUALITY PROTEIN: hypothetical protein U9M48_003693 [Paspalum notatum var. saurae]|uniref:Transposase-associated domain-containing protein n=1 Tax=Paspalum notatum var. saurae TaxID=547442 RepID=A0AAQ3PU02_PASNO